MYFPAGQPSHAAAPSVLVNLPSGHGSHVDDPGTDVFHLGQSLHVSSFMASVLSDHFPAGQSVHGEPVPANFPAGHPVHVSDIEPSAVDFPSGQSLHVSSFMAPVLSDHFPPGQLVHGEPNSANSPAGHSVHVSDIEPTALVDFPSGQSLQLFVSPPASDHFPKGQSVHVSESANCPVAQISQEAAPLPETLPRGQVRHG